MYKHFKSALSRNKKSVNLPTEQIWGLTLDSPYCHAYY